MPRDQGTGDDAGEVLPAPGREAEPPGLLASLRTIVAGPLKLLPEAIQSVPAVKYALAALAVAGCIAVGLGYFKNPRLALIATIVGFALMGLLVIFARVAKLPGTALKLPAVVFAWTCLLLFIVWSAAMTTSVFVGYPLQIALFSDEPVAAPTSVPVPVPEEKPPYALIVPDRAAVAMMSPPRSPFVVTIEGKPVELHREGLLIGEAKSLSKVNRERYRTLVDVGEPTRYPAKLSEQLVNSIVVTYDGKPCKRPDLNAKEQRIWVLELDFCP